MKRTDIITLALAIACASVASSVWAQGGPRWRGSGGWGAGSAYNRLYDTNTVETVTGEIARVERITPRKGMSAGVHLTLKTEKETVSVHLGPAWYVENQDVKIESKDKIEIRGSRATFDGKPALIAAELKKGDEILKLRDETGVPAWSGWRRH